MTKFHGLFAAQTEDKSDTINIIFLWDTWKSTFPVGRNIFNKFSVCPVHCAVDKVHSKVSLCSLLRLHLSQRAVTLVGKLEDTFGPEKLRDFCVSNEITWIIRCYFTDKNIRERTFLECFFPKAFSYFVDICVFFITVKNRLLQI